MVKTLSGRNSFAIDSTLLLTQYKSQVINGYDNCFIPPKDGLHLMWDLNSEPYLKLPGKYWI